MMTMIFTVAVFGFAQTSYTFPEDIDPNERLVCVILINTTIENPIFTSEVSLTALPGTADGIKI